MRGSGALRAPGGGSRVESAATPRAPRAESREPRAAITATRDPRPATRFEVHTHGGRTPTGLDAVEWARECVRRGAGEILLTSIDRDGARTGYDLALTQAVADAVDVPVIASGGAGNAEHVRQAIVEAHADAALVAGILHDRVTTVQALKGVLREAGVPVRDAGVAA